MGDELKLCSYCGTKFQPQRPLQSVCSPTCASRKVKEARTKEKAEFKKRKEAIKTIPELKKEAQNAFNAYIRERDKHLDCISCGKPASTDYGFQKGRDCGHYRSVGAAKHLRYNEDNAHAQCVHCNQWKSGNVVDYRIRLIERIGQDRVTALETDSTTHKWNRDELIQIKETYRQKLKDLKEKE